MRGLPLSDFVLNSELCFPLLYAKTPGLSMFHCSLDQLFAQQLYVAPAYKGFSTIKPWLG